MPFDLVYISPPFARPIEPRLTPAGSSSPWLAAAAYLLDATDNSYVAIEQHRDLVFVLPHRLLTILAGQSSAFDQGEPYPEAFVVGSGADYAEVVHETAASARTFDLLEAFAALRVTGRSALTNDLFAGTVYRCLYGAAAAKLGRCLLEAAAKAHDLSAIWVPPIASISDNTGDGGQDGLLQVGNRAFWIQITGGEKPGILPHAKWPEKIAEQFFLPEGGSQMKAGRAARRRKLFGDRTPPRADILHLTIGKSPPLALTPFAVRGAAREKVTETGRERQFLQTVTIHPLMVIDHRPDRGHAARVLNGGGEVGAATRD